MQMNGRKPTFRLKQALVIISGAYPDAQAQRHMGLQDVVEVLQDQVRLADGLRGGQPRLGVRLYNEEDDQVVPIQCGPGRDERVGS